MFSVTSLEAKVVFGEMQCRWEGEEEQKNDKKQSSPAGSRSSQPSGPAEPPSDYPERAMQIRTPVRAQSALHLFRYDWLTKQQYQGAEHNIVGNKGI